jgi:hypothetical protein
MAQEDRCGSWLNVTPKAKNLCWYFDNIRKQNCVVNEEKMEHWMKCWLIAILIKLHEQLIIDIINVGQYNLL